MRSVAIARSAARHGDWNVLAIAKDGMMGPALSALGELGAFRTAGYPRVLVGHVAQQDRLFEILDDSTGLSACLSRLLPLERSVEFKGDDLTETLCEEFSSLGDRIAGRTFYVRAHLRGLKGRLTHPAVERALGSFLFELAAREGRPAKVAFGDPDLVVCVEVAGNRAGYAFLDSTVCRRPLVRIR